MSNLGRFLKEEEIEKLLGTDEEKDYSGLISSIVNFIHHSRLGLDPLAIPDESSGLGSLSVLVPAFLGLISGAGITLTVPLTIQALDLLTDLVDTYDNWLDDEVQNPDSPYYGLGGLIRKYNRILGDIWNYNNPDYSIDLKWDGAYNLSEIFTRAENGKLWNIFLGNALNFGHWGDEVVEKREEETYNFKNLIKFHPGNREDINLWLTKELMFLLNINTWRG